MARTNTLGNYLSDVAAAIKRKLNMESSETIPANQFDTKIDSIETGIPIPTKGFVFSDFDSNGFPRQADLYGNNFPDFYFMCNSDNLTKAIWGTQLVQTYPTSYVKKIVFHTEESYHYTARRCFAYNKTLETVEFPENVTDIYMWGGNFLGCSNLKSFPISKINGYNSSGTGSIYEGVFNGCTNLESDVLVLPDRITSICVQAFQGCTKINFTSLNKVRDIGYVYNSAMFQSSGGYVFNGCTALSLSELPAGLTTIYGPNNFANCVNITISFIPDGVTSLPNSTFNGCTSITTMDINNVTGLGSSCFQGCTGLTSIEGAACTSIGSSCFYGCSSLVSVSFPNLRTINSNAFQNVTGLTTLDLTNVTSIQQQAFSGCTGLGSITTAATTIAASAFNNCTSIINAKLTAITSMTTTYVFQNCTGLKNVLLPAIVTFGTTNTSSIFSGCTSLKRVWIGSDVTTINRYAFYNCQSVETIYIDLPRATMEAMTNYSNYKFSNSQLSADVFICNDDSNFISQTDFEALMEADEPVASQGNGE